MGWIKKKLKIDQNSTRQSKISFEIKNDNTLIHLRVIDIKNFKVYFFHLNQPDIYGKKEWKIDRDYGTDSISTNLNKGKYSFTLSGRTIKNVYSYEMEVSVKEK